MVDSSKRKDVISVLKELGSQKKIKNSEMLEKYRKQLKTKKKSTKEGSPNIYLRVPARIPIVISKNAKNHLTELKETKKIKNLKIKEGLKKGGKLVYTSQGEKESLLGDIHVDCASKINKDENYGLSVEKKGKKVDLSLHYPKTPVSMRTVSQRFQGDLSYKMKLAIERKRREI